MTFVINFTIQWQPVAFIIIIRFHIEIWVKNEKMSDKRVLRSRQLVPDVNHPGKRCRRAITISCEAREIFPRDSMPSKKTIKKKRPEPLVNQPKNPGNRSFCVDHSC